MMDIEMEGPVDDVEAMLVEDDEDLLAEAGTGKPSNNPWGC